MTTLAASLYYKKFTIVTEASRSVNDNPKMTLVFEAFWQSSIFDDAQNISIAFKSK